MSSSGREELSGERLSDRRPDARALVVRGIVGTYAEPVPAGPVTSVPAPPAESIHRVPPARVVDRIEFVLERAAGRRVIHLGFVDETRMEERVAQGSWLHGQLARVAKELVGIDASRAGVQAASAAGYEAYLADLESPEEVASLGLEPGDLLLAGELVEHLANPGRMLEAVRQLLRDDGSLVITTPNAHALTNTLAALAGLELVNSDHVGWQSWWTARELLARHGYDVRELAYYPFPRLETSTAHRPAFRARVRLFNAYLTAVRPLYRLRPSLADGLILVASRANVATAATSETTASTSTQPGRSSSSGTAASGNSPSAPR